MRSALVILLFALGGAAFAQDGAAPMVPTEAPAQPGTPAEDEAAGLPALPMATDGTAPAGMPVTPATDGTATGATGAAPPADGAGAATAPTATGEAAAPAAPEMHTDLYSIVMGAHWVVQAVMAGLAVAAFVALVIFIHKTAEFAIAFRRVSRTARRLAAAPGLAEAQAATASHKGPAADMVRAAAEELELAEVDPALRAGVRERTAIALSRIEAGAAHRLRSGTGILASIGSLSPFVGLFGTVFGIMNSFLAIAESKTTNLAVVAPGIAEALFATAIGLAAAIPAVLIYNICSRRLARFRLRLNDVGAAAQRLQSRALDRLAATEG